MTVTVIWNIMWLQLLIYSKGKNLDPFNLRIETKVYANTFPYKYKIKQKIDGKKYGFI